VSTSGSAVVRVACSRESFVARCVHARVQESLSLIPVHVYDAGDFIFSIALRHHGHVCWHRMTKDVRSSVTDHCMNGRKGPHVALVCVHDASVLIDAAAMLLKGLGQALNVIQRLKVPAAWKHQGLLDATHCCAPIQLHLQEAAELTMRLNSLSCALLVSSVAAAGRPCSLGICASLPTAGLPSNATCTCLYMQIGALHKHCGMLVQMLACSLVLCISRWKSLQ